MQANLLTDTEACIHLGITKELLYAYVRYAPKKHLNHDRKLITEFIEGKSMFDKNELDSFNTYLMEPWSETNEQRPAIPKYIKEYLKTEIGGKCPITQKGFPLEDAHLVDYSISRSHHHHNIIRIAKDEHTKYDNGVLPREILKEKKKELIESIISNLRQAPGKTNIITYLPNVDASSILGREDDLIKIHDSIHANGKATVVNGIGGIGKTTIAQLYAQQYHSLYENFLWLEFSDVFDSNESEAVFMSAFTNDNLILDFLGVQIEEKVPLRHRFSSVINKLGLISGRTLMILDNAPMEFGRYSLRFPNKEKLHILVTSRKIIEGFPAIQIDSLEESAALKLFYTFYSIEQDDELVVKILDSFGRHTLTIELLSKLAKKRTIGLEKLFQLIQNEGLNLSVEAKVISEHDKVRNPAIPFNYLCNIFDVSDLSEKSFRLLGNLSIIGSVRLTFNQLQSLLDLEFSDNELFDNLDHLYQLGWVTRNENTYVLHQLVGEVLRSKLKPTFESCSILVSRIREFIELSTNEIDGYSHRVFIQVAEQLITNLKVPEDFKFWTNFLIARFNGNMGDFDRYNEWYSSVKLDEQEIVRRRSILVNHGNILLNQGKCSEAINILTTCIDYFEDETILAQVNVSIGHAYSELGEYSKAACIIEKAIITLEKDPNLNRSEFAVALNNYSNIMNGLGKHRDALEYGKKSLQIREEILTDNHPLLAQSYNNTGVDYEYLGELDLAFDYHQKALNIRKSFGNEINADLGETYHNIASVYFRKGENSLSKKFFEKAIYIREKVYPEGSPSLIMSYCCYASLLIQTNAKESVKIFQKAFKLIDTFDFSNNKNLPTWMIGYSIALYENNDLANAVNLVNQAHSLCQKLGDLEGAKSALSIKSTFTRKHSYQSPQKPSRNAQCPCGSGKKYKKCCGINYVFVSAL